MDSSSKLTDNNTKQMVKKKLINQQNISFQVLTTIATKEKVLKQHSRHIDTLMMSLMVFGALKAHFHCCLSQQQVVPGTAEMHGICTTETIS